MSSRALAVALLLAITLPGCATLDQRPRAAASTVGCVRNVLGELDIGGLADQRAHCIAAARIAQRCSVTEAVLASYLKELRDVFAGGDAAFADLRADHAGIRCARTAGSQPDHPACCADRGF